MFSHKPGYEIVSVVIYLLRLEIHMTPYMLLDTILNDKAHGFHPQNLFSVFGRLQPCTNGRGFKRKIQPDIAPVAVVP